MNSYYGKKNILADLDKIVLIPVIILIIIGIFSVLSASDESIIVAIGDNIIDEVNDGTKAVIYGEVVDDFHCIDESQIFTITTPPNPTARAICFGFFLFDNAP